MTGTAKTEEVEFEKTYKLEVTVVPTNRTRSRLDLVDQVYKNEAAKWRAVAAETAGIHRADRPALVGRIRQGLMLSNASMLPLGALMVGLAGPIVALVYERGAFDSQAAALVGGLLMAYGLGMPAYLGRDVLVRVFYALGDGVTPFRFSMAGIGFNVIFDWVLVGGPTPWGLQLSALNFGAPGLVLATVAVNLITCVALLLALRKRLGELPLRRWASDTALLMGAALVAGLAAWILSNGVRWPAGLPGLLLQGGLSAGLGMGLYGLLATAAGVPEAQQLSQQIRQRLSRRS